MALQMVQKDLFSMCEAPKTTVTTKRQKPAFKEELKTDFTTSAKTAIFRNGPSAPIKTLIEKGLLGEGSALNYGKGKYDHDTNAIAKLTGHCVGYDYTYSPCTDVLGTSYDYLYSGYCVNTLPIEARQYVWAQMASCVRGIAFVAARTDGKNIHGTPSEDGVVTKIGTFQKAYQKNELKEEALEHFDYVVEIKGKSGFSIVACSHSELPEHILAHAKK
ncbi:hypothetical protein [Pseudoalteromonas marina]|uniref:Uncharacterized protein n=2 Tax=Bacteria TaxID=2 RepID=A0ABT9FCF3_9GAMM|nr:hypothetical protein [Pseudoalteromonas marina]MDP2564458.1 hypothetical protein [Pseudoalteromonas marina]